MVDVLRERDVDAAFVMCADRVCHIPADPASYLCEIPLVCLDIVTGTTVVNGTIEPILEMAGAKAVFYGISIAGVTRMLSLERFCPR